MHQKIVWKTKISMTQNSPKAFTRSLWWYCRLLVHLRHAQGFLYSCEENLLKNKLQTSDQWLLSHLHLVWSTSNPWKTCQTKLPTSMFNLLRTQIDKIEESHRLRRKNILYNIWLLPESRKDWGTLSKLRKNAFTTTKN